jgi:hypothetical protein
VELNVWRKSSRSGSNGQCVEVMDTGADVMVRDSKNPTGPALTFTRDEWRAFIGGVHDNEFTINE